MKRRRGRPSRQYNLQVRTVRRDPIDYESLARAALEQAAMDQRDSDARKNKKASINQRHHSRKEHRHDYLE